MSSSNSENKAWKTKGLDRMNLVDDEYETKMVGFVMDCQQGKGEAEACQHVGEYLSVIKNDHKRSANIFAKNCQERNYAPSCFNLARQYCK